MVVLEIGVSQGGSLQMWKDYFGEKAKIFGIDIDPRCEALEEENIKILTGSQSDRKFLREVKRQIPPIDILVDEGGHMMIQKIVSFEELFPHIKEDSVYLCEDLHTSYWLHYGGGHKRRGSFIEYSKNFGISKFV
ncbi:MAG: class I SAM-dependent methyltransferase [Dysgonamonadaceae bacterium]|nr:class I SAM-dependent methyltransferase [Dysgonamonadaceae bacterium]